MAISKWLCTKSTKNTVVKVVHPGGHKELHDRPVLASEIMRRNPKCVVAYPNVFQQPWAIVAPNTTLRLGQKYYIVPVNTIRKLQRHSLRKNPSPVHSISISESESESDSFQKDNNEPKDSGEKEECFSKDKCFMRMIDGIKIKASKGDASSEATSSPSNFGSSETKGLTKKKNKDLVTRGTSPNRILTPCDHWQPGLERVCEE